MDVCFDAAIVGQAFLIAFVTPLDMEKLAEGYISKLEPTFEPFGVDPMVRCVLAKGEELHKMSADEYGILVFIGAPTMEVPELTH